MNYLTSTAWIALVSIGIGGAARTENTTAGASRTGLFRVTRENKGVVIETVRFRDPTIPEVQLPSYSWPGVYQVSANEKWLLRIQKVGSGESIALLYRIQKNGRVSEIVGFDENLWKLSDSQSRLKKKELYHTAIQSASWVVNDDMLEVIVQGKNAAKSGDGIETRMLYDLEKNKFLLKSELLEKHLEK